MQSFPLLIVFFRSFGEDWLPLFKDLLSQVLSNCKCCIVTTWKHDAVKQLLIRELVSFNQVGRGAYDVSSNL